MINKSAPALPQGRKSIYLEHFEQRPLSRLILIFVCKQSLQLPTLGMILTELKQLLQFPILSKSTPGNRRENLNFVISGTRKNMKLY